MSYNCSRDSNMRIKPLSLLTVQIVSFLLKYRRLTTIWIIFCMQFMLHMISITYPYIVNLISRFYMCVCLRKNSLYPAL